MPKNQSGLAVNITPIQLGCLWMEAANIPHMIFTHYRELVAEKDASAWFSIELAQVENLVPIEKVG
ncbi:MAG: hypothetical protein ACO1QB_01245 [Verrucomicrobiales bacterium]